MVGDRMKKTFILIFVTLFMFALFGCCKIEFNAEIVKEGISFNQEWLDNNQVYNTYNLNIHEWDLESPEDRTFIITDENQLDEIFTQFPDINFENEILIVYCYGTIYCREQKLKKVILNNDVLEIEFDIVNGKIGHADAAMPHTRMCVIRMDKIEFSSVDIKYIGQ